MRARALLRVFIRCNSLHASLAAHAATCTPPPSALCLDTRYHTLVLLYIKLHPPTSLFPITQPQHPTHTPHTREPKVPPPPPSIPPPPYATRYPPFHSGPPTFSPGNSNLRTTNSQRFTIHQTMQQSHVKHKSPPTYMCRPKHQVKQTSRHTRLPPARHTHRCKRRKSNPLASKQHLLHDPQKESKHKTSQQRRAHPCSRFAPIIIRARFLPPQQHAVPSPILVPCITLPSSYR